MSPSEPVRPTDGSRESDMNKRPDLGSGQGGLSVRKGVVSCEATLAVVQAILATRT